MCIRDSPFTVQVWRSGTFPTGPYIKFADLQNYVKNTSYKGNIGFQITTANDYGASDKSGSFSVAVDLQRAPTASSITQVSGKTTVTGEDYFVINRKPDVYKRQFIDCMNCRHQKGFYGNTELCRLQII